MPDDDAGRDDFFILACHVKQLNGDPAGNVARYAAQWWPVDGRRRDCLEPVRRVFAKAYTWGADTLGARIGLLDSARTRLGIRTIGGMDIPKEGRQRRKRDRWNAKRRTM